MASTTSETQELDLCPTCEDEMTSAMELLRDELTKSGVEWEAFDVFEPTTQWSTYNGAFVYWARERDGKLLVETTAPTKCSASCTPEQAVEITLGPGTCHNAIDPHCRAYWFSCSGCGLLMTIEQYNRSNFCPHCGRRIVKESE